jgi:L-threonylcarbamoyladenylate synthase
MPEPVAAASRPDDNILEGDSPGAIQRIIVALRHGDIVSFPTDTVYALAASITQGTALGRLYEAKGRPESKPIPVLLSSAAELEQVTTGLDPAMSRFVDRFWPGQLTVVMPARPDLPREVTATSASGSCTVAVRVPNHSLALRIIECVGGAVAATSANVSGRAPSLTAADVRQQLGSRVRLILDGGRVPGGIASTIVEIGPAGPVVLRQGGISNSELARQWHEIEAGSA